MLSFMDEWKHRYLRKNLFPTLPFPSFSYSFHSFSSFFNTFLHVFEHQQQYLKRNNVMVVSATGLVVGYNASDVSNRALAQIYTGTRESTIYELAV